MFYYGNGGACCPNTSASYSCPISYGSENHYAIVLVLFILLVIILGCRTVN